MAHAADNGVIAGIIWSALTPGAGAALQTVSSSVGLMEDQFLDFHLVKASILHFTNATNCARC